MDNSPVAERWPGCFVLGLLQKHYDLVESSAESTRLVRDDFEPSRFGGADDLDRYLMKRLDVFLTIAAGKELNGVITPDSQVTGRRSFKKSSMVFTLISDSSQPLSV